MIAALLLACGGPGTTGTDPVGPDPKVDPPVVTDPSEGTVTPIGDAPLPEASSDGRPWRRMDIEQLDASMRQVTNGIGWDVNGVDQFTALSATLGVPDYLQVTSEDLAPGLLFQKFLDDAANAVCRDLLERESTGGAENVFLVHVDLATRDQAAIEENLSMLLLRFHGREVPVGDPRLEPWIFLYEGADLVTGGDAMETWRTVCVALFTHPDFYTY
ncbi:MAG: hypothetical protein H6738_09000 [Alphaproteobacteria bacterium]|nr:hypothetical protein [Alphaproteobacteria bacterium]